MTAGKDSFQNVLLINVIKRVMAGFRLIPLSTVWTEFQNEPSLMALQNQYVSISGV